ncbi:MAG: DUF5615 family PIN-like protein [Saprospiraceae bacterium]|jgi:predicted nuclease of predicted toxin-antitoxin system|nr:DUF5615 family PIN-like protein [Saprospiraceae bacterium]
MKKFFIDANLPYYFSIWNSEEYIHVIDINDEWEDDRIWEYAKKNSLTIVTKDSDFSERIILNIPPPRVIHIKFGNVKMKQFYLLIVSRWDEICKLSIDYKLVNVFHDRIEGID